MTIFKIKRTQTNDEKILSMSVGQSAIEELINSLVNETIDSDHDENLTVEQLRTLMKKHYTVGGLVDVLSVFGPVNEDVMLINRKNHQIFFSLFIECFHFSLLLWVKLQRLVLYRFFVILNLDNIQIQTIDAQFLLHQLNHHQNPSFLL